MPGMSQFEISVMEQLSEIKTIASTAEANTEALNTRLFNGGAGVISGLQADIQEIKDERKEDKRWDRVHNIAHYSLAPILVGLHAVARHFGITW